MLWLLLLATLRQASRWSLALLKFSVSRLVSFFLAQPVLHQLFT
jgi:hypothetical protein